MAGLTRLMRDCLRTIDDLTDDGVPPSYEEIRVAMGLPSKSGVHRLIEQLSRRGYVRRIPACARSLEIVRRPA
ncbi:hypothetical protein [Brevundimonas sp.]|uniref:LexA family protein n=1 Tax=Brevundimonas sp. TaxID=1871086 RepID=UPI0039184696